MEKPAAVRRASEEIIHIPFLCRPIIFFWKPMITVEMYFIDTGMKIQSFLRAKSWSYSGKPGMH
jgi:hypothetical protein